jgi:predicted component of type VI protein secretion system
MTQVQLHWENLLETQDHGEATLALPIMIGRAQNNDVVLAAKEAGVSRWHACIRVEADHIVLVDQHSTNGIYVGQERISKTMIKNGLKFRVGAFVLTLTLKNQCSNPTCQRMVDQQAQLCPWCGRFLADAITRGGLFQ